MKKVILFALALAMLLSLCACGGNVDSDTKPTEEETTAETKITKEELLASATQLMNDEARQIFDNPAFANTLIGKTYTFTGKVYEIQVDYIDIALTGIPDEAGQKYGYDYWNLSFHLYLPVEDLVNVKLNDTISFVGQISAVETKKTADPSSGYDIPGTVIIMKDTYIME